MANEPMKMQGSQCWFVCMVQVWVLSRSSRSTIDTQHISTWQTNLWFDSNLEGCSLQTLCLPALMFQCISIIWDHDHNAFFSGMEKVNLTQPMHFWLQETLYFVDVHPHVLLETTNSHVQQLAHLSQFASLAVSFGMFWRPASIQATMGVAFWLRTTPRNESCYLFSGCFSVHKHLSLGDCHVDAPMPWLTAWPSHCPNRSRCRCPGSLVTKSLHGMGGNFRDLLVQNVGNGWVAGGCWDDDITSDDWDHSRKFPAFSTSKKR